ncbi:hypothetical protein ACJIZ3_001124 [Penstemon smallii]|uniref:Uncharacterized protein n=1 Tax=Penstemon smallii TaxID=265156 RepID=A0ABD3U4G1_9LAMI
MTRSDLREPEMDAALLLIQLSGDSAETVQSLDESVGNHYPNVEISSDDVVKNKKKFPRKKRFRSIQDLYTTTKPVVIKKMNKSTT